MRARLARAELSGEADEVVAWLLGLGYLDDAAYARARARALVAPGGSGRGSPSGGCSSPASSAGARARRWRRPSRRRAAGGQGEAELCRVLAEQRARARPTSPRSTTARARRLARFLLGRGFSGSAVARVLGIYEDGDRPADRWYCACARAPLLSSRPCAAPRRRPPPRPRRVLDEARLVQRRGEAPAHRGGELPGRARAHEGGELAGRRRSSSSTSGRSSRSRSTRRSPTCGSRTRSSGRGSTPRRRTPTRSSSSSTRRTRTSTTPSSGSGESWFKDAPSDFALFPPVAREGPAAGEEGVRGAPPVRRAEPDLEVPPEAKKLLAEADGRLAAHEWYVAEYYFKHRHWAGAAGRYETLVEQVPGLEARAGGAPQARPRVRRSSTRSTAPGPRSRSSS